jgi:hypothetical protein
VKLALVVVVVGAFAFASNATAATITGVVAGGSAVPGPNVTTSGATPTSLSHAEVGAWAGDGHAPEPRGTDSLTISIDVGAGGRLDFDWSVRSVDGCYYDPIRVYLQTPGGRRMSSCARARRHRTRPMRMERRAMARSTSQAGPIRASRSSSSSRRKATRISRKRSSTISYLHNRS